MDTIVNYGYNCKLWIQLLIMDTIVNYGYNCKLWIQL